MLQGKVKKLRRKLAYLSHSIPITSTDGNENMSFKDTVKVTYSTR